MDEGERARELRTPVAPSSGRSMLTRDARDGIRGIATSRCNDCATEAVLSSKPSSPGLMKSVSFVSLGDRLELILGDAAIHCTNRSNTSRNNYYEYKMLTNIPNPNTLNYSGVPIASTSTKLLSASTAASLSLSLHMADKTIANMVVTLLFQKYVTRGQHLIQDTINELTAESVPTLTPTDHPSGLL